MQDCLRGFLLRSTGVEPVDRWYLVYQEDERRAGNGNGQEVFGVRTSFMRELAQ